MAAKSQTIILMEFFGKRPDISGGNLTPEAFSQLSYQEQVNLGGVRGFAAEIKRLLPEEKLELAQAAAKQLGYTSEAVDFPLA